MKDRVKNKERMRFENKEPACINVSSIQDVNSK